MFIACHSNRHYIRARVQGLGLGAQDFEVRFWGSELWDQDLTRTQGLWLKRLRAWDVGFEVWGVNGLWMFMD